MSGPLPTSDAHRAANSQRAELYRQRAELDEKLAALRCYSYAAGVGGCQLDRGHDGPHECMAQVTPHDTATPVHGRVWWDA